MIYELSFGWREVSRFLSFLSEDFGVGWGRKEHLSLTNGEIFLEDPKEQEVKNVSISGVRVSFLRV